jgi:PPOX class probable F420-dependent enzyme
MTSAPKVMFDAFPHPVNGQTRSERESGDGADMGGAVNRFEAEQRFARARVAHLATIGPDGPHLVPCTFAVEDGRIVSVVDRKPKRTTALQRLANIRADPRVSLLVDRYDEDWQRLWWVRADGRAAVVDEGPDRDAAVTALVAKYPQYVRDTPRGPAVIVEVDRWRSWTAGPAADET